MSNANLGWMFYKDYYKGLDFHDIKGNKNETLIGEKVDRIIKASSVKVDESEPLGNIGFEATTVYPGLLLGSGYAHELPGVKGQAILGFHFDYTTGLPVIPGSSIKGVLRSAFEHTDYIKSVLNRDDIDIEEFKTEIFDNGDIFFDAVITGKGSAILGDDYITPHDKPIKDPFPLRFIKVMPGVKFRFDFELDDGLLNKKEKALLFAQILNDLGIGAKTNVGYGQFKDDLLSKAKNHIEAQEEERKKAEAEAEKRRQEEEEAQKLASVDSPVEKVKVQINMKNFTKQNAREIHELLQEYVLTEEEKQELLSFFSVLLGPKPKPKNKAVVRWTIKIYEYLGV